MIVVSDPSPIINLAAIGQLTLLEGLYSQVVIAHAVYDEILAGSGQPGSNEVQEHPWLVVRQVVDTALAAALGMELDQGEAETIALAHELQADIVLLDEIRARGVAKRLGLRVLGLLGVLVEAKSKGLVSEVKPLIDGLISEAGFWVARNLYDDVLRTAGE